MPSKPIKQNNLLSLIPTAGIFCFVCLYLISANLYPGGSQEDLKTLGFDWINNYWCNLLNEKALNGKINPARPLAIRALFILCFSLALFFNQFSKVLVKKIFLKKTISLLGVISMVFMALIFTEYHDLMINLSCVTGGFVVLGIIWELYKSDLNNFKIHGVLAVCLMLLNHYIYYSSIGISYLPLLQKITFAYILLWVISLNIKLTFRKNK